MDPLDIEMEYLTWEAYEKMRQNPNTESYESNEEAFEEQRKKIEKELGISVDNEDEWEEIK